MHRTSRRAALGTAALSLAFLLSSPVDAGAVTGTMLLTAQYTQPVAAPDGMRTTVLVETTCSPEMTCDSIRVAVVYRRLDEDGITRNHVNESFVGARGVSTMESVYPADGELIRVVVSQRACNTAVIGGCGTWWAIGTEVPTPTPVTS